MVFTPRQISYVLTPDDKIFYSSLTAEIIPKFCCMEGTPEKLIDSESMRMCFILHTSGVTYWRDVGVESLVSLSDQYPIAGEGCCISLCRSVSEDWSFQQSSLYLIAPAVTSIYVAVENL